MSMVFVSSLAGRRACISCTIRLLHTTVSRMSDPPEAPDPYLSWDVPYGAPHIIYGLQRRGVGDTIRVFSHVDGSFRPGIPSKKSVWVMEAPEGVWGAWAFGENGSVGLALPVSATSESGKAARDAQVGCAGVDGDVVHMLKVPECDT